MRRVLFLTYVPPERLPPLLNSAELLAGAGIGVDILALRTTESFQFPHNANIRRFFAPNPYTLRSSHARAALRFLLFHIAALRLASRFRYPVIVAHDPHSLVTAHVIRRLCGAKTCYHCHEFGLPSELRGLRRLFKHVEHFLLRKTPCWIVPERARGELITHASGTRHVPFVVANCPRLGPRPTSFRLADALAKRGRRYSRIIFRQGILGPGHSVEQTIRSIRLWADSNWGLVFMGFASAAFLGEMRGLASAMHVADRVVFLPPVAYIEVLEYIAGADIGLALYEENSLSHQFSGTASNKLFEYLSAGVPIVANDSPLLRSLVVGMKVGVLADPSDPSSIANAINSILTEPRNHAVMSGRAYELFRCEYNYEAQYAPVLAEIKGHLASSER